MRMEIERHYHKFDYETLNYDKLKYALKDTIKDRYDFLYYRMSIG